MNILILEDDQSRIDVFRNKLTSPNTHLYITENIDEALDWFKNIKFDVFFLDHDLGGNIYVDPEKEYHCGTNFVNKFIELVSAGESLPTPAQIYIHTLNKYRGEFMMESLKQCLKNTTVKYIPYHLLTKLL